VLVRDRVWEQLRSPASRIRIPKIKVNIQVTP